MRARNYRFDYEPTLGRKSPDYLIILGARQLLAEVKEFGRGDLDIEIGRQRRASEGIATFVTDPFARVRKKIEAGAKQLRPFKRQWPSAVVIHNPGYMVFLSNSIIEGALARFFTPTRNTSISAVCILEETNEGARLIRQRMDAQYRRDTAAGRDLSERVSRLMRLGRRLRNRLNPGSLQAAPSLRTFANPHAVQPLPPTAFRGRHDRRVAPQGPRVSRLRSDVASVALTDNRSKA